MKTKLATILSCATLLVVAQAQPSVADDVRLNADEIRQLILNKCVEGRNKNSTSEWFARFFEDGKVEIKWRSAGRAGRDKGTWCIEDDTICTRYRKIRGGAERCDIIKIQHPSGTPRAFGPSGVLRHSYTKVADCDN